jgi:hypothetical protein
MQKWVKFSRAPHHKVGPNLKKTLVEKTAKIMETKETVKNNTG